MDREIPYRRVYAVVDLDAVAYNMEMMKANLPEAAGMMAVVKTDGYGHGAAPVAWAADPYADMYAVATAEEALNLRSHGISKPILILGPVHGSWYKELIEKEIRIPVFTWRQAEELSKQVEELSGQKESLSGQKESLSGQAASRSRQAEALTKRAPSSSGQPLSGTRPGYVHLVADTGMSRIGMRPDEESADLAVRISRLPGICVEGLFTHFARADEEDKTSAFRQAQRYKNFVEMLESRGLHIPVLHISNSAGIIDMPEISHIFGDGSPEAAVSRGSAGASAENQRGCMVRAGISIYGLYPSNEVKKERVPLKPAMELKSFITYIKEIGPGDEVSYGGTFVAEKTMRVATVSVGYGDGYPRNLSGKGRVLIRGKSAPVLGRVCMDQMMVDVTHIPEAEEWDTVTLIGTDGRERISVEELADTGGGFHYEIVCDIGKRVPRVYIKDGRMIGTKDYFQDVYKDFVKN